MDRLSALPEDLLLHIISFLPTKLAARTSLLSRRFQHLWESSGTVDLCIYSLSNRCLPPSHFYSLARRTIRDRVSTYPLLRLNFRLCCPEYFFVALHKIPLSEAYIASLFSKASSIGLRHLSLQLNCHIWLSKIILPCILSMCSLESLSLEHAFFPEINPSTPINLKNLKSLHIVHSGGSLDDVINRVILLLHNLEDLYIQSNETKFPHLKSTTLKKLKLNLAPRNLRISTPSLEVFELDSKMYFASNQWDWEMPMLRKATIQLKYVEETNVEVIFKMLNAISNVQELRIDIIENVDQAYIFHALLLPGVDPPTFFNLKHFNLEICFHECNIEDLVTIVQHSPVLESLQLVHKPPCSDSKNKKKKLWRSQLPQNAEGNYRHAYFEDLHIPGKKEEVLGQIMRKQSSKRLKT